MKITSNKVCSCFEATVSAASSFSLSDSPNCLIYQTHYTLSRLPVSIMDLWAFVLSKFLASIVFPFKVMTAFPGIKPVLLIIFS